MKLLLANYHLVDRAGSELYTLELATALRDAGHEVGVFTFSPGPIAQQIQQAGIRVFSLGDRAQIESFRPELIHTHHAPCLYFLAGCALTCPVVHGMLGPQTPFERPPMFFGGVALGLAISEEVRDSVRRTSFGAAIELQLFRNWFDDRRLERPRRQARVGDLRHVVVVTNHLDPTLVGQLDALAERRPTFRWTHWGAPQHSVPVDAQSLEGFDAVVSIGRTALLAAGIGKPCLLYDVHGCDGWMTAERLGDLATCNFSGRLTGERPALETLERLFFDDARHLDLQSTADACGAQFGLNQRVKELEVLHASAVSSGVRLTEAMRPAYANLGDLFHDVRRGCETELNARIHLLEEHTHSLEQRAQTLQLALAAQSNAQAVAQERADHLAHDLDVLRGSAGVQLLELAKRLPGLYRAYLVGKRATSRWRA